MAGKGRPGPAPGHGGRPRVAKQRPDSNGYIRESTGPAGRGTLRYVQDVKTGLTAPGHKGKVADHRNGVRSDNRPSNLRVTTRSVNRRNQHPAMAAKYRRK